MCSPKEFKVLSLLESQTEESQTIDGKAILGDLILISVDILQCFLFCKFQLVVPIDLLDIYTQQKRGRRKKGLMDCAKSENDLRKLFATVQKRNSIFSRFFRARFPSHPLKATNNAPALPKRRR